MKLISSLLLTLFFAAFTFSQENNHKEIDSLLVLMNTKQHDTAKVNLYSEIAFIYLDIDVKKFTEYNNKIFILSKKTNYLNGLGIYYSNMSRISYKSGEIGEGYFYADKAASILKKTNHDDNYLQALYLKAFTTAKLNKLRESELIIKQAFVEAKRLKNTNQYDMFYHLLGQIYSHKNDFQVALQNYKRALFYYRKNKDDNYVNNSLVCLLDIGDIYIMSNQLSEAMKYIQNGLRLVYETNKNGGLIHGYLLNVKGNILNKSHNYSKALPILLQALAISEKIGSNLDITQSLYYLSETYYGLRDFDKVISTCEAGLKMKEMNSIIDFNYMLGKVNYTLKDYNKALLFQTRALNQKNAYDFYDSYVSKAQIYIAISETEFALRNYKQAYLYYVQYSTLDRKFLLDEKKNRINELLTRFDVNEKEIAIKNLTISKQKRDIELQGEKNKLMIGSIFFGSTLLFLGIVTFGYKKNRKKNRMLTAQNIIIQKANIELEIFQTGLKNSLKEKEILLKEIHHRVKNNLQLVMSLLNIQARQGDYFDINDFLEKGQSRIASMALIHQNIYQTENLDRVDFQEYLVNLVENLKNSFSGKQGNIDFSINAKDIYFDIETSIPLGLVINELVCNALKHAFPGDMDGKISIELNQKENYDFELTIRDNGIGIEKTVKSKKSLGLELVNLLVAQLKGKINNESVFGTDYTINFQEIRV